MTAAGRFVGFSKQQKGATQRHLNAISALAKHGILLRKRTAEAFSFHLLDPVDVDSRIAAAPSSRLLSDSAVCSNVLQQKFCVQE